MRGRGNDVYFGMMLVSFGIAMIALGRENIYVMDAWAIAAIVFAILSIVAR